MTFNFLCPKRCEQNFGVGRSEVSENENVMLSYAGRLGSDPEANIVEIIGVAKFKPIYPKTSSA